MIVNIPSFFRGGAWWRAGAAHPFVRDAALLFLLALAVHGAMQFAVRAWVAEGYQWSSDAVTYWRLAQRFQETGMFTMDPAWGPTAFRTPLYPLFLAGTTALLPRLAWAIALQGMCAGMAAVLLYALARRVAWRGAALAAALFFTVDLQRAFTSAQAMSESLFLVVFLAGVLLWLRALDAPRVIWHAVGAGLCLGLASLVRPIGWIAFLILAAIWVAMLVRKRGVGMRPFVAFLLTGVLVVSPWAVRNGLQFGHYGLSPLLGINLYNTQAFALQEVYRQRDGDPMPAMERLNQQAVDDLRLAADIHAPDWVFQSTRFMEFAHEPYFLGRMRDLVMRDPVLYLTLHIRRAGSFVLDGATSRITAVFLGEPPAWLPGLYYPFLFWFGRCWWLVVWAGIVWGVIRTKGRLIRSPALLAFFVLFFASNILLTSMNRDAPRLRMPLDPLTYLLLGAALTLRLRPQSPQT